MTIFFSKRRLTAKHRILAQLYPLHPIDIASPHRLNSSSMIRRFFIQTLALATALTASFQAPAEEAVSVLKIEKPSEIKSPSAQYSTDGKFSVEGAQYPSSIPGKPELDRSLSLRAHLRPLRKTESSQALLDFSAEKVADWGTSNFTVKEVYWNFHWRDQKSNLTLGRKIEFWSQLDEDWQLGMWQPKSLLDGLRPEDQGLTGVFYRHQQGGFEMLGLVSPVFIPTMGPNIKEENGNLVADSRWFRSPSTTFVLFEKQRRVVYSLDIPQYEELINNPGLGMRLSYGKDSPGTWVSVNGGYKPLNSLILKYDKKLALTETGQDTGDVPLVPSVTYHQLWGADLGYRFENSGLAVSYLEDTPLNESPEDPFIIQYANPMKSYSFHADTQLQTPFMISPVKLLAGYLRIDGGDYKDFDTDGEAQGAVFVQRFNFYNAAQLKAELTSSLGSKKFVSRFAYLREFEQQGMIASAAFDYYPLDSMMITVGADVLGVDDTSDSNRDSGFLNQYRANDRGYAGVSYVF